MSKLSTTHMHAVELEGASFCYLPARFADFLHHVRSGAAPRADEKIQRTHVFCERGTTHAPTVVAINSMLGAGVTVGDQATLYHSRLRGHVTVGQGAFVTGVDLDAPDGAPVDVQPGMVLCQHRMACMVGDKLQTTSVWSLCGVDDALATVAPGAGPVGTFCHEPWAAFFERTGLLPADLWDASEPQCAATAKLFPAAMVGRAVTVHDVLWLQPGVRVGASKASLQAWRSAWRLSWQQLTAQADVRSEFAWRQEVQFDISRALIRQILLRPAEAAAAADMSSCILPYLRSFAAEKDTSVLSTLDQVNKNTTVKYTNDKNNHNKKIIIIIKQQ